MFCKDQSQEFAKENILGNNVLIRFQPNSSTKFDIQNNKNQKMIIYNFIKGSDLKKRLKIMSKCLPLDHEKHFSFCHSQLRISLSLFYVLAT